MYSFLLILGIIILSMGFFIDRKELKSLINEDPRAKPQPQVDQDLRNRIEILEDILYSSEVEVENESGEDDEKEESSEEEFLGVLERQKDQTKINNFDINEEMKDQFKLLADYERGILSLEEISKELNMQKGEVLLLRNIYRKYQE